MRSDEVIATAGQFIANTMTRKLRFLFIVLGFGMIGILFAHGFSLASVLFAFVMLLALGAAYITFSFWIWFFRNLGRSKEEQR